MTSLPNSPVRSLATGGFRPAHLGGELHKWAASLGPPAPPWLVSPAQAIPGSRGGGVEVRDTRKRCLCSSRPGGPSAQREACEAACGRMGTFPWKAPPPALASQQVKGSWRLQTRAPGHLGTAQGPGAAAPALLQTGLAVPALGNHLRTLTVASEPGAPP